MLDLPLLIQCRECRSKFSEITATGSGCQCNDSFSIILIDIDIEKERISEVSQVQEIQSRPPKFITLSEFSVQLIVPILKLFFRFNFVNNIRKELIERMARGFSKVRLKV
mgnify:CR=1 FL=1